MEDIKQTRCVPNAATTCGRSQVLHKNFQSIDPVLVKAYYPFSFIRSTALSMVKSSGVSPLGKLMFFLPCLM